jgi:hypothetical protein
MTYCHVSRQIALHADNVPAQTFGDLGEWEQEFVVSELAEAVLSDNASLAWEDYPHIITSDFAMQSLLEEADFIEELANSVLNTPSAKTLLINQRKAETKALIKHALDETGTAPQGYDFKQLLGSEAA